MENNNYCTVPQDDMDGFLNYLKASLRQVEDLKNYIFKTNPSLDEASLEENEYEFLRIPDLNIMDEEYLFSEIYTIFEKYSKLFEKMEKLQEHDDGDYSTLLKQTLQNSRVLLEHVSSWLEQTPQPADDAPEEIWTFSKSNALIRDITIIKTYIKILKLILESLNKLKCIQMFYAEDFTSSNSI